MPKHFRLLFFSGAFLTNGSFFEILSYKSVRVGEVLDFHTIVFFTAQK